MSERDFDRLGYRNLITRWAEGAYTPRGRSRLAATRPAAVCEEVERRQRVHAEIARVADGDPPLPVREVPEAGGLLKHLRITGAVLEGPLLWSLLQILEVLDEAGAWCSLRGDRLPFFMETFGPIGRYRLEIKQLAAALEPGGHLKDDASPLLLQVRRQVREQEGAVRELARSIALQWHDQGWAQEPEPVLREGRLVIAVRTEARGRADGVAVDRSRSGQTLFLEPRALADAALELKQQRHLQEQEELRILAELTTLCAQRAEDIDRDLDRLAVLDAHLAVHRFEGCGPLHLPVVGVHQVLDVRQARHPVLALTLGWRQVVPLTVALDRVRTLVISGPNSGGKTVALQTIGLCGLLAMAGLPVPADEGSRFPFWESFLVDLGDEQSVEADLSTFTSHLQRWRPMLVARGQARLCLIDEAGAGTDPGQGAALALAVLEALTDDRAWVIATTHNGRIKEHVARHSGMQNGRMVFSNQTLTPTYLFEPGEPGRSFALEIAARAGMPDEILQKARALMDPADWQREEALQEAEDRRESLRIMEREGAETLRQVRLDRERYERLARQLEIEADQLRSQARAEAAELVRQGRRQIEHLVKELRESRGAPEQVRQAQRRLRELERANRPAPLPPETNRQQVQVGQKVWLAPLERAAVVESLDGRRARVRAGSLSLDVAVVDLQPAGSADQAGQAPGEGPGEDPAHPRSVADAISFSGKVPVRSVAEKIELIGMRKAQARERLEKHLDDALMAGLERLVVVHGVGTGALRSMVHQVLADHPEVSRFDLDREAPGGSGVTVVRFRGQGE